MTLAAVLGPGGLVPAAAQNTTPPPPLVAAVLPASRSVLVSGQGGSGQPTITEFPLASGSTCPGPRQSCGLDDITAGPDGALWFVEGYANKIGRITTAGAISEFPIPTASSFPSGIAAGSDGALWFTELGGNQIGRITTGGAITEFAVPTVGSFPFAIAAGPDGALWFTENAGAKIGRITTAGVVSEFPVSTTTACPFQGCGLDGIAAGSDGALWFADSATNTIDRITTAGAVTSYPIRTATSGPFALASGPDGNLWFIETLGNQVGRVTTAGIVTEFSVPPLGGSAPPLSIGFGKITSGPDGALWFTFNGANQIGRITTVGVTSAYAIPTATNVPYGITNGPNGALWYAADIPAKIASLVPPVGGAGPGTTTALAFATMINLFSTGVGCAIAPVTNVPASFFYQTTDPTTNALIGTANTPVNLLSERSQSFVIGFTPTAPFAPTDVVLGFTCTGGGAAPSISGVNTLLLSASATAVPDVVALALTPTDNGILAINGATGGNAFAVATVNVGAGGVITATADTGAATLPLALSLCETNPANGQCLGTAGTSVTTTINADATPTFAIFATSTAAIPPAYGTSRIFVRFKDSGGASRGLTSVAVQAQ